MTPVLETNRLCKTYTRRVSLLGHEQFQALDDVSMWVPKAGIIGIAGESGSGKSTLARCLATLEEPDSGEVVLHGRDLWSLPPRERAKVHKNVQLIFQDPASSFNWNWATAEIIAEPLAISGIGTRAERKETALSLMRQLGLPEEAALRSPLYLSGGQRQRVAIARALALKPTVLIFDESFSGLDLCVQSQIRRLLFKIREQWQVSCVVISHDLGVLARFTDYLYVMSRGAIIDQGVPQALIAAPQHEGTRALVASQRELNMRLTEAQASR
jgi:peptide/nickel transport system ATP-binding protein